MNYYKFCLKRLILLIGTAVVIGNCYAHSVQVRYCLNCDAQLRLWFEHWHGAEDYNQTTMTIQYSVGGGPLISQTESPVGSLIDVEDVVNLPGCKSESTYAAGCDNQNTFNDWVYYDYDNLPTGVPVAFTIISGNSPFTQDGCGMYPLQFTITIPPSTTAPLSSSVSGDVVCVDDESANVALIGGGGINPYTFQYSLNNGSTQSVTSVGDTAFVPVPTSAAGGFSYEIQAISQGSTAECSQPQSSVGVVTINPLPTATISGSVDICIGDLEPAITFTGADGTAPYTFSYSSNAGEVETITSEGNTATVSVPSSVPGTFEYELLSVQDASSTACSQTQEGTAVVVINPFPTASISGSIDICVDDLEPIITFTGADGTAPYTFSYTVNGGTLQTVTSAGNTATVSVPASLAETYEYELISVQDGSSTACLQTQEGLADASAVLSAVVVVNPLPTATISGSTDVCVNDSEPLITFTGDLGTAPYAFTYTLNGGIPQVVISGENTATVNVPTSAAGTFEYALISIQESSSTACSQVQLGTEVVIVNPLPTASISGSVDICIYDLEPVITFTGASGTAPYTFSYTINGGDSQTVISAGNTAEINVPSSVSGTFEYELVSVQDASSTACTQAQESSATVLINDLPIVQAGEDFMICINDQTVLAGSGALTYLWDNEITDEIPFSPVSTKTYIVTGTDVNGCVAMDDVVITVNPLPVVSFFGDSLETCGAPFEVEFTNTTPGDLIECTWSFETGVTLDGCSDVIHVFEEPGLFDVTLTTTLSTGCINSITYPDYIWVKPDPIASFIPSASLVNNLETEISFDNLSEGAMAYAWDFGDLSEIETGFSPVHVFPNQLAGVYLVELIAYTDLGCTDTISEIIEVEEEDLFYVPNTFTPNNDGYNETFKPVFTSGFDPDDFNLSIYDRAGSVIFQTNDASLGWDGTFNGKIVQNGTYIWKIITKSNASPERYVLSGHVNMVK